MIMSFENLMPIGNCIVCGEYLDHSEAGFCETCGQGFHWGDCGDWDDQEHKCDNCKTENKPRK